MISNGNSYVLGPKKYTIKKVLIILLCFEYVYTKVGTT